MLSRPFGLAGVLIVLIATQVNAQVHVPPNILLLVFEDFGLRVGAYGDAVAVTPNIDRLAKEGVLFRHAFTTAGVCAPSRSSLITGVHQQTLGTMHMRTSSFGNEMEEGFPYEAVPPAYAKAFPELLRQAGYYTINDDKTDYQFGEPFTIWDQDATGAFLARHEDHRPFFAMVNFFTTHEGYTWSPEDTVEHPLAEKTRARNRLFDQTKIHKTNPGDVSIPPYYPRTKVVAENIARHYDNIAATDARLGEFLNYLEEYGLLETSILIFTSDHGDGLPRAKRALYDSGLAVPLIIRFPSGKYAGTSRHDLVSFVDLAPTILSFAGVSVPDWMQGRVILGASAQAAPDVVFAASDRNAQSPGRIKAVRSKNFKYIRNYRPEAPRLPDVSYQDVNPIMHLWRKEFRAGRLNSIQAQYFETPSPEEELYLLSEDPHEIDNLAHRDAYQAELQSLRNAMDNWIKKTGDLSSMSELEMVEQMWPDGKQPQTEIPKACLKEGQAIKLFSDTPGASIGYQTSDSIKNSDRWLIYTKPLEEQVIQARAIRYGFQESPVTEIAVAKLTACALFDSPESTPL